MQSDIFLRFIETLMNEKRWTYADVVKFFSHLPIRNDDGTTVVLTAHPMLNNYDEVSNAIYHFEESGKPTIILNAILVGRETKELPISEFALQFAIEQSSSLI